MLKQLFGSHKRPYFRDLGPWEKRTFDLSGCQLEITMPPHDFEFPEEERGTSFNVFDSSLYSYETEPAENGAKPSLEGVSSPGVFLRKWDTFGPVWRSQPLGFLQSSMVVCDISRMNTSLNCFNPEHLEKLIIHGLYYSQGPGFGLFTESSTPVNWQIKNCGGLEHVYFESWPKKPAWVKFDDPGDASDFTPCLITPLFEDKYLYFAFSATGSLPAQPSIQLMRERIERIIPSIKLTLSPEAARQKAAVVKQYPDAHYSQHRDPEPWQYYSSFRQGDPFKGEDNVVLEGESSPPPSLD